MPSTLQVVNGVLNYTAGVGVANHLTVSLSGATYTFADTSEKVSALGIPGTTGSGTNTVALPAAQVQPAGMLISLGDLNDSLSIESTANAVSVQGGDGSDLIDVGKFGGGTLGAVAAPVTVDGQAGADTLRINDPTAGAPRIYTVTATGVTTTSGLAVNYAGTENLAVNAGLLPNTFNVLATAALTRTTINGGINGDTFNVGSAAKALDDIQGLLTLNGASQGAFDQDAVNLLDQGSTVAHGYVVRDNGVARSGAATIIYSGMEGLTLNAGSAADGATVVSTAAGTPVTLNMGAGNDVVNLATRTGSSLDLLLSPVTVNGEAGTDSIILNDQVDTIGTLYVVTATDVSRAPELNDINFLTILNYANAESLTLNAGNFGDGVSVQSTSATTPVTLKMGDGIDHVSIGPVLSAILLPVTVDGQGGSRDGLALDDTNGAYGQTYTVTSTTVSRSGAALVSYAGIEFLAVVGAKNVQSPSSPPNRWVVKSTSADTFLNGPIGLSDEYVVGSDSKSLDGIQEALSLSTDGIDSLVLDDSGDLNGNSYALTATGVARSGAPLISLLSFVSDPTGLASLTLNAGPANDAVTVQSLGANGLATLNLGAGNDAVTFRQDDPSFPDILSPVEVNGGAGADAILVDDSDVGSVVTPRTYTINTAGVGRDGRSLLFYNTLEGLDVNAGGGNDDITVLGSQATLTVRAGLGDDVFHVGGAIPFAQGHVTLDGQGGANTLDYSASLFGVRVNLALGAATGVDGGVSNIQNVNGGQANDIIVGNDQDNVLQGGPGRDILIGRGGADTIYGETPSFFVGDGDDIVIGASTVYDLNAAALEDIMREWGRTDLTGAPLTQYYTRINHLLGVSAGGLNGTTFLDLSKTIDDGAADYLDGGPDLDWSFRFTGDTTLVNPGERIN